MAFCAVDRLTERAVPKDRAVARRAWQFVGTTGGTAADEALQIYVVHAIPGQAKERLAGLASADPRESVRIPSTVRKSAPCPWPGKAGQSGPTTGRRHGPGHRGASNEQCSEHLRKHHGPYSVTRRLPLRRPPRSTLLTRGSPKAHLPPPRRPVLSHPSPRVWAPITLLWRGCDTVRQLRLRIQGDGFGVEEPPNLGHKGSPEPTPILPRRSLGICAGTRSRQVLGAASMIADYPLTAGGERTSSHGGARSSPTDGDPGCVPGRLRLA